jgi:hypothetical protein
LAPNAEPLTSTFPVGAAALFDSVTAGEVTVKLATLVALPPGVVTLIVPVVDPAGTVAVIWLYETTLKPDAVPWKVTCVAPLKALPAIEIKLPTEPLAGAKPVILGFTLNSVALVALPVGVITLIAPVVASDGTMAVILMSELTTKPDAKPWKRTSVAPVKPLPLIVTLAPTVPAVGLKLVIAGAA